MGWAHKFTTWRWILPHLNVWVKFRGNSFGVSSISLKIEFVGITWRASIPIHGYISRTILYLFAVYVDIFSAEASVGEQVWQEIFREVKWALSTEVKNHEKHYFCVTNQLLSTSTAYLQYHLHGRKSFHQSSDSSLVTSSESWTYKVTLCIFLYVSPLKLSIHQKGKTMWERHCRLIYQNKAI